MDPLIELLLELGARAKLAERAGVEKDKLIADLTAKVESLTPKPEEKKEA